MILERFDLVVDGVARTARVNVPGGPGPWPVIVALHGGGGTGEAMARNWDGWQDRGYALVFPDGLEQPDPDQGTRRKFVALGDDLASDPYVDERFVRALLERMHAFGVADSPAAYVCGHSSGGNLAQHLAVLAPDLVRGCGPVGRAVSRAIVSWAETNPTEPRPVCMVYGAGDPHMAGTEDSLTAAESAEWWAAYTDAPCADVRSDVRPDGTIRTTYDGSPPLVVVRTTGGHEWPAPASGWLVAYWRRFGGLP